MRPLIYSKLARDFLDAAAAPNRPGENIETIALIGAIPTYGVGFEDLEPGEATECGVRDEACLLYSLQAIDEMKLPRVRNPKATIYNLNDGDDLLRIGSIKADAVFLCFPFLFRPTRVPIINRALTWLIYTSRNDRLITHFYAQSPLSFDPKNWHKALVATDAKVIANVSVRDSELPITFIDKPPYGLVGVWRFALTNQEQRAENYEIDVLLHQDWPPMRRLVAALEKPVPVMA